MPLRDYLPFLGRRREFATVGKNPPFTKDSPRDFGAGVIKRIKLQNNSGLGGGYGGGANKEPQIGDNRTYMNVYLSDPIIRTLIDLPCIYAAKDGYDIVTDSEEEREVITSFFDEINLEQIIYSWLRNGRIFGTGYLEYTGDNLVLRSSQNMYVQRDPSGQVMYYYQDIGDDAENVRFEETEIIEYKNNPFDDYAYGLSDIHPVLYLVDLKDYAERDIGAALNKYATSRFDISAGLPDMPYGPDKINEIVDAFNSLEPGEDIIHGNDITIKEMQGTQRAFEYGKYTDDIMKKIHIALKVPVSMFDKPEEARAIFEPYVKHLQSAVEAAINSQLMPQLESGEARFSFRQINVGDAFTKAKTDMIYLSEGVLSPGEVRLERGLNPEGIVEQQETAKNANLSGGKDQDKTEESERVENRNLTGDREQ
jgi:hypothetical protein|tara:strand:- start:2506 stop:3777 length:1272 start_codon:yes stop_codon:yes gene_type:complete